VQKSPQNAAKAPISEKSYLKNSKSAGTRKKSPKSEISQTWANVFVRRRLPGSPRGHLQSDLCPYSHPVV